jgi:multimeric flavodoxin WrbA
MLEADGVILGSPVYVAGVTGPTKCFIDRAGFVNRFNDLPLNRKVGAGVVVYTRAGALPALEPINNFILGTEMIIVGSSYWCLAQGSKKGAIMDDEFGMNTFKRLDENMAWLLEKVNS